VAEQGDRKKLRIVIDAKYYTSQLAQSTIDKTVDDMNLRCDKEHEAYGLLICSQSTKLDEFKATKQHHKLSLVKL
jgi:hypothetical protein